MKKEIEDAYINMKIAQQRLADTRARVEPRLRELQARRDELRKQSDFCLMMAMACFSAPTIILLVIAIYRMVA